MAEGIGIGIGNFPVQNLQDAQPGLGTQACYEALCDLQVEIVEKTVINIRLVRLSSQEWPKLGCRTAK